MTHTSTVPRSTRPCPAASQPCCPLEVPASPLQVCLVAQSPRLEVVQLSSSSMACLPGCCHLQHTDDVHTNTHAHVSDNCFLRMPACCCLSRLQRYPIHVQAAVCVHLPPPLCRAVSPVRPLSRPAPGPSSAASRRPRAHAVPAPGTACGLSGDTQTHKCTQQEVHIRRTAVHIRRTAPAATVPAEGRPTVTKG